MDTMRALVLSASAVLAGLAIWTFFPGLHEPASGSNVATTKLEKGPAGMDRTRTIPDSPLSSSLSASTSDGSSKGVPRPIEHGTGQRLAGSAFEASFLTNGFINDRAIKLLESKDFGRVVAQLDAQNAGQRNAVTDQYRAQVESTLASFKNQARLDRFACGTNVCVASIVDPESDPWFQDWYDNVQSAATLPIGALAMFDATLPGGRVEHRILFTTHPDSRGFSVDPSQR